MPDRTGFVIDYRIELLANPGSGNNAVYFRVTIADNKQGANADEYKLIRNISSQGVDRSSTGTAWALSFGSLELALIATLKDALLHDKRVTVTYFDVGAYGEAMGGVDNRISAVRMLAG